MKHLYVCDKCGRQFDDFHECDNHEKSHVECHYELSLLCQWTGDGEFSCNVRCYRKPTGYKDEAGYGIVHADPRLTSSCWYVEFESCEQAAEMLQKIKANAKQWFEEKLVRIEQLELPREYK